MSRHTGLFAYVCLTLCLIQEPTEANICTYEDHTYTPGQSWSVHGRCEQWTCLEGDVIIGKTCPVIRDSSGEEIFGEDLSLPYPACCPKP